MGQVIRFKRTLAEPADHSQIQQALDLYARALAAINFEKAQIEAKIKHIESQARVSLNPNFWKIALQQLADIKKQLLVASCKLLDEKDRLLNVAESISRFDGGGPHVPAQPRYRTGAASAQRHRRVPRIIA
jgi:hypothetical protein